ncbi:MAG TPA: hypothetical protein VF702_01080 [Allosphingosinicella sp.]|jgi:hypothetical protein
MRRMALAIIVAALGTTAANAQGSGRATSAYTRLQLDRCTVLSRVEEGASIAWRCSGYRAVPLFVMSGDDRFDLDAGIDNGVWESPREFNSPPTRIEWRLRGGRPFAIIYRLFLSNENGPLTSVLIVESVGRDGAPGCQIAEIDARVPSANALARSHADTRASRFRCGIDQIEAEGPAR